ncbi:Rid family hydrolase [Desertihabitans aurantiacus]|uniref:Rid family hydrolase n=1 Tax=Desertihabitans aurantiacus TaxID=2282477 RepID=UPI000DF7AB36|nr:Rid family hydrolase [Desertihabitans aurantiacus]
MTTPQFTLTPGYGQRHRDLLHYSQAVRIGDRVEISGQGGWDDDSRVTGTLEEEIVQAFENVGRTLATAGARWSDVVSVTSYHRVPAGAIGDDHNRVMVEQLRARMGERAPIWTQVGVTALGLAEMNIEISVVAHLGDQS